MKGKTRIVLATLVSVGGAYTAPELLDYRPELKAAQISSNKATEEVSIDLRTLDGKESMINTDGTFKLIASVKGENLDKIKNVRFYVGNGFSTVGTNSIDVNADGTSLTASCEINPQTYLNRGDFKIQLTYSTDGTNYPKAVNLNSSVAVNKTLVIGDIKYAINAKEGGQVSFNVSELGKTPSIDENSIDGKLSTINSDGTYTFVATATGENLDTIDRFRFYIGNNYGTVISDFAEYNTDATQVKVSFTIDAKRFLNAGSQKIRIAYSTDGNNFNDSIALKSSIKLDDKISDGINEASIFASANQQIEIKVNPIVMNPEINANSLDGKLTTLNSDGTYTIRASVTGQKLDAIQKVRIYIGGSYATLTSDKLTLNSDATKLSAELNIDGNRYLNSGVMPIGIAYATNDGLMTEKVNVPTSQTITDEINDGLKVFKLNGNAGSDISINVTNVDTEPHFDLSTLDGKLSKINSDGSFSISATVDGSNLNNINRLRMYIGNSYATLTQEKLTVSENGQHLSATVNIPAKTYLDRGEFPIYVAYSKDTVAYSVKEPLTTSQKISSELTVGKINSKLSGEVNEQIKLSASSANVEPVFTSGTLDGKLSTVNSDGSFTLIATVKGENLQNINRARIYVGNGYSTVASNNLIVSGDGTSLRASINLPAASYLDRGQFKIRATYSTEGTGYQTPVALKTSQAISNSVIRGTQKSSLIGNLNQQIAIQVSTYNPNISLNVTPGTTIPTYELNKDVTAKQLLDASNTTIVGDGPFTYSGSIDTSIEGTNLIAQITVTEQSGDQESKTINLKYNVVSSDTDLSITTGNVVPTYMENDTITSSELFTASESKLVGDGPFSFSGTVDTSNVGNNLSSKVTVTEQGGDHQSKVVYLNYNVSARPVDLKLSAQSKILKIEQGYTLKASDAIAESGIEVISGDAPIEIKAESNNLNTTSTGEQTIAFTATEQAGDKQVVNGELRYEVVAKANSISQERIPEYIVNTDVDANKLVNDAEVVIRDEDGKIIDNTQFAFSGNVNTNLVNDDARAEITYQNKNADYAKERVMSVKYKVLTDNVNLELTNQTKTLKIEQGTSVKGQTALSESGISVTAGDLPVDLKTATSYLNTSVVGEQSIAYTASEQNGDKQEVNGNLVYEVVPKAYTTEQTNIPAYDINTVVSAPKLVADANVKFSDINGNLIDLNKFSFTGVVDTSIVGEEFTSTITYKQNIDYATQGTMEVKYKVNPVFLPLTISEQVHVPSYVKDSTVSAEQLVSDAQVEISGDGPFEIKGLVRPITVGTDFRVNVTIKELSGDFEEEVVQLAFDVTAFDADNFFTTYSNDHDNWGFDDDNVKLLTEDWFDNDKNRGFYSNGYYDLSKPVKISGDYYITGDAVTNAAGISFMFHDGAKTNIGGIDGQLGIMTNDFDPIATHSIAAALDTDQSWNYDTQNDHMEISYVDDKKLNQVQTFDTGTLNGLRTKKGEWRSWEVKWEPETDSNSEMSGQLYFTAQDGQGVPRTLKQDVTKIRMPQGLYTFKVSGTSGIFQEKKAIRVKTSTEQVPFKEESLGETK